ncbi:uncharacterized protein LOC113777230 [Coffea eugenioides]|uniref:uncharacterized protein LOC113777230 n=1 Tax=Coffea eugenioides TaxID=49369 RepID=UPI000F60C8EF|nr:uncharacterized protein LOC113777230 [Coffea eugenioides]
MEGLQTSQLQQQQMQMEFRTKLEENSNRVENLVAEIKQELSAFMRTVISKKRAVPDGDRQRVEQAPLLPTPPLNQRLQIGSKNSRTTRKETSKILIPNPPKIDLPMFAGENLMEWIRKYNKYCLNYQIPEDQKVEVIEMYLERKADNWLQGIKLEKPRMTWKIFAELLYKRFDNRNGRDVVEKFNKLRKSGKVEEYQEKFEEFKTLMIVKNPHLDEEYFVCFISGLKDEVKIMIKMLKPTTLSEAFDLAALQEKALRLQRRTFKKRGKAAPEDRFGISRNSSQH